MKEILLSWPFRKLQSEGKEIYKQISKWTRNDRVVIGCNCDHCSARATCLSADNPNG
jgi:hypothetical protein